MSSIKSRQDKTHKNTEKIFKNRIWKGLASSLVEKYPHWKFIARWLQKRGGCNLKLYIREAEVTKNKSFSYLILLDKVLKKLSVYSLSKFISEKIKGQAVVEIVAPHHRGDARGAALAHLASLDVDDRAEAA